MYSHYIFVLIVISVVQCMMITNSERSESDQLHKFMNENELNYYFNTNSNELKIPNYEIIKLKRIKRKKRSSNDSNFNGHSLYFEAFKRPFQLELKPNSNLISPYFHVISRNGGNNSEVYENFNTNCIFLHHDENSSAAFHNCFENKFEGLILAENLTLEVKPLNENLLKRFNHVNKDESYANDAYLIKKAILPDFKLKNISKRSPKPHEFEPEVTNSTVIESETNARLLRQNARLTIEVGVFFDEAAYKSFAPLFNYDERKLSELLLAYMNSVQILYHHPSLGIPIDISIVRMEIMRRQPSSLPAYNGERNKLLDSFCDYHKRNNPPEDTDPRHWDIGLYLTGLDVYSYENGVNSGATLGLATVRGACSAEYSCLITEFGVDNAFGRPYPSAGFNSVYILAHEIGHSLGMNHDSTGNYCSREGYIMSPSRGTQGETSWSHCSATVARDLTNWAKCLEDRPQSTPFQYNAWKYLGYPGQFWSTKRQCEILLRDKDAFALPLNSTNNNICQNLQCKSPHKSGFFFAGPALEGSDCGANNWCEDGYCTQKRPIRRPHPVIRGGWSEWKYDRCSSSCIINSKGYQTRRRYCDSPKPINTNEGCEGLSYDTVLCNDVTLCQNKPRLSIANYASAKCKEFSKFIDGLDPNGVGLQAPHEENRLWMGCAIFCRRRSNGSFYTPRFELNDLGKNAYFPDGTLCHSQNRQNFYCLQHHCLPEGFSFTKNSFWIQTEDVPIAGNAVPNTAKNLNPRFIDYLSLDKNGKPILKHLWPSDFERLTDDQWTDYNDYRLVEGL